MRWKLLLFSLIVWFPLSASGAPKILVLGDSLSAGYGLDRREAWVTLLEQRLQREGYRYDIVNASISGETTRGGRNRITRLLETHRPAVVIVELGGNDGLRGWPIDEIRGNLSYIIEQSRKQNALVLLAGMQLPPNYGPRYTRSFTHVYAEVAKQHNIALVPFFLEGLALNLTWFQPDGIHPSAQAQPVMLENVWRVLRPLLGDTRKSASG